MPEIQGRKSHSCKRKLNLQPFDLSIKNVWKLWAKAPGLPLSF